MPRAAEITSERAANITMIFGLHCGVALADVPREYRLALLAKLRARNDRSALRQALELLHAHSVSGPAEEPVVALPVSSADTEVSVDVPVPDIYRGRVDGGTYTIHYDTTITSSDL